MIWEAARPVTPSRSAVTLAPTPEQDARLPGTISEVAFLGSVIRVRVDIGGRIVSLDTFNSPKDPPPKVGERATIHFATDDWIVLPD